MRATHVQPSLPASGSRSMNRWLLLLSLTLIASCKNTSAPTMLVSECLWTRTITVTANDIQVMSDGTKRQILAHNRAREAACASSNK